MLGQLFDKPGSEKGLTVKKAVQLQNNYKAKKTATKKEPPSTKKKLTGSDKQTTQKGAKQQSYKSTKAITYPNNADQTRDYLRIKCIEYISPSRGTGKVGSGGGLQVGQESMVVLEDTLGKYGAKGGKFIQKGTGGLTWKFGQGSSARAKKAKKTIYTVNLPIPQQVSDNLGVTWGESTMNLFELAGLQIAQDFMESPGQAMEAYMAAIKDTDLGGSITPEVEKSLQAALSGTALNALGSNVTSSQVISRSTGQVLNSNRELIFEGVQLRTFPFNIQFSPRDPDETKTVLDIIRKFKQSMSPKKGEGSGEVGGKPSAIGSSNSQGGMFIKAPDVFLLEYMKGGAKHPFLNSFKVCALTSMAVNYTGAGTYATYSDSTPIKITVDLSFKELEPVYNQDYDEISSGVGY